VNKIASDIKFVFHSSTVTMMHGAINVRFTSSVSSVKVDWLEFREIKTLPKCVEV